MDHTPTTLFDAHEQDFLDRIQSISDKLSPSGENLIGERRKAALRKAQHELEDAEEFVSSMEAAIQEIPRSVRAPYTAKLAQAKATLTKYKNLRKQQENQAGRMDLLGGFKKPAGSYSDDPYGEQSDRARLLAGTETLADGSRRIQESTGVALETERYGADVLRTLRGQRDQLENSRNMLEEADTHVDRATTTLKGMVRQMYKQRIILSALGVFFVLLVLTILYFKLVRR